MKKSNLFILFFFLILAETLLARIPITDTLTVDSAGVVIDSVDLGQQDLLAVEFPATMNSDTVFIKTKNLPGADFIDAYYTDNSGEKKRCYVIVEAGAVVGVHPIMTYFLGRYISFVTNDVEDNDRTFITHKGKI